MRGATSPKRDASNVSPDFLARRIKDAQLRSEKYSQNGKKAPQLAAELARDYGMAESVDPKTFVEFLRPSELRDYEPPEGIVLIGDNHITRGSVFVIGGAPGVGKSRASVALAEAGATGYEWFDLKVHSKFRTLIIQNENGRYRMKLEFSELDCETMDEFVRVTPPPPYGICFDKSEFRDQLAAQLSEFDPAVVIIDPWNAASRDDKAKGYLETFEVIRSVIPASDRAPAIGIVAHTRKPQPGERASGRALLNLLAGSYVLGSIPRCVFIIQSASDAVDEQRVVWTCCKNNDGVLGERSVWERRNGLFTRVHSFDWEAFDEPDKGDGHTWKEVIEIVSEIGDRANRKTIIAELKERGASQSAAYRYVNVAEKRGAIRLNPQSKIYGIP
jgi:AAA domain